jgi:hypothetical protein
MSTLKELMWVGNGLIRIEAENPGIPAQEVQKVDERLAFLNVLL